MLMFVDLSSIEGFYLTPYGETLQKAIQASVDKRWSNLMGVQILGLGFCHPYLEGFAKKGGHVASLMPERMGVCQWPLDERNKSCQGKFNALPFADKTFERIFMCHSFELGGNPNATLEEAWRVLAPGGRIILVVPNRSGLLARSEHSPFGRGTPYSRTQLKQLLINSKFEPISWCGVGLLPPSKEGGESRFIKSSKPLEGGFLKPFSGVIVMEAEKRVFSGLMEKKEKLRPFPAQPAPI